MLRVSNAIGVGLGERRSGGVELLSSLESTGEKSDDSAAAAAADSAAAS